jgi:hypothetical protein
VIVCFTLDLNCEERRRRSNVQYRIRIDKKYQYKKEEEERAMNANEKKIIYLMMIGIFCV